MHLFSIIFYNINLFTFFAQEKVLMDRFKKRYLFLSILVTTLFFITLIPSNAQAQGEIGDVKGAFKDKTVRQAESGTIEISFMNTGDASIYVGFVGIHFDWMEEEVYFAKGFINNPIYMKPNEIHKELIDFDVDEDVAIGVHSYHLAIQFQEEDQGEPVEPTYQWTSDPHSDFQVLEKDTDSDGVADSKDAFPTDPSESKDTDQDGVGDNRDDFPLDPTETTDTDRDGVGDNTDLYPRDPDKWKKEEEEEDSKLAIMVAIIFVWVIAMALIVFIIVIYKYRKAADKDKRKQLVQDLRTKEYVEYQEKQIKRMKEKEKRRRERKKAGDTKEKESKVKGGFCPHCGSRVDGEFCTYCGKEK
jgi:hypothetical protein